MLNVLWNQNGLGKVLSFQTKLRKKKFWNVHSKNRDFLFEQLRCSSNNWENDETESKTKIPKFETASENHLRKSGSKSFKEPELSAKKRYEVLINWTRILANEDVPIKLDDLRVQKLVMLINEAQIQTRMEKNRSSKPVGQPPEKVAKRKSLLGGNLQCDQIRSYCTSSKKQTPSGSKSAESNRQSSQEHCIGDAPSGGVTTVIPGERESPNAPVESSLNSQINAEMSASYEYLSMATHFGRSDVGLSGFYAYFMNMFEEEIQHALGLVTYVNLRGWTAAFTPIGAPVVQQWSCPLSALEAALKLEEDVTVKLMQLHAEAESQCDIYTMDLITTKYIAEQYVSMNELRAYIARLGSMPDNGIGSYLMDYELSKKHPYKTPKID